MVTDIFLHHDFLQHDQGADQALERELGWAGLNSFAVAIPKGRLGNYRSQLGKGEGVVSTIFGAGVDPDFLSYQTAAILPENT